MARAKTTRCSEVRSGVGAAHRQLLVLLLGLEMLLLAPAMAAGAAAEKAADAETQGDYCVLCEPPGSHTMCAFPPGPAPNCSDYQPAPLTPREKRAIVRTHNLMRSRVATGRAWARASEWGPQPTAAHMRQLHWDEELAAVAQRWADRCLSFHTLTPHDACRDSTRFPVGQNIVTTAFSKPVASDVRARVLDWYAELAFFDPAWVRRFAPNPDPDPAKQIGHYTQMMWGSTHSIGCARVVFQEQLEGQTRPWVVERMVCNYAPSGNFLHHPVYEQGAPCSACPPGTACSRRFPGLCDTAPPGNGSLEEWPGEGEEDGESEDDGEGEDGAAQPPSSSPQPQNTVKASSEASTERASDENVVLEGARALENGTRPPETFLPAYGAKQPLQQEAQEAAAPGGASPLFSWLFPNADVNSSSSPDEWDSSTEHYSSYYFSYYYTSEDSGGRSSL